MPRNPHNLNNPHANCGPVHTPTSASENIKLQVLMNKLEKSLKEEFVSKEQLKTINLESLLGSGNIDIKSIDRIEKTSEGLIDTYIIHFSSDFEPYIFTITNGAKGEKGDRGEQGQDGLGIKAAEIINGELVISYTNDTNVILGRVVGADGKEGQPGQNGSDGVGIKAATINDNGYLVLALTNDTSITAGKVVGQNGENGADGKSAYDLAKENGYKGTLAE